MHWDLMECILEVYDTKDLLTTHLNQDVLNAWEWVSIRLGVFVQPAEVYNSPPFIVLLGYREGRAAPWAMVTDSQLLLDPGVFDLCH